MRNGARNKDMQPKSATVRRRMGERLLPSGGDDVATRRKARGRDEAGAVLVLALLFLVVIGLIVGGLASWTANSLTDTLTFQQSRSAQYALTSASQVAIQSMRYSPLLFTAGPPQSFQTLNANPPSYCWGSSGDPTYGGSTFSTQGNPNVNVYCSTVWNPTSAATRVVTISACLQSNLPQNPSTAPGVCAANPGLQTIVTFDDYSANTPAVSSAICSATCGNGMTIDSSTFHLVTPTVTALSSVQGPVTGGTALTVTGTGFVSGSTTVNFVSTNPSQNLIAPAGTVVTDGVTVIGSPNITSATANFTQSDIGQPISGVGIPAGTNILSVTSATAAVMSNNATASASSVTLTLPVTVNSATSLSLTTPSVTTATSYYVIVTTPNGSSTGGPSFTYQPVVPTVSGISIPSGLTPPSGSAAGGTSITITGTGFLSNLHGNSSTVNFVDVANSAVTFQAPSQSVSVNATGTVLTAVTPGITSTDTTYYVTVTTAPGGTSAQQASVEFTFQPLYPVVSGISPTSGPLNSTTAVTITGIGFVSGATTIQLIPQSGFGTTVNIPATNVSVSSSTTLTTTIPAIGGTAQSYYVQVTTTTGGASGTSGAPVFTN